MGNSPFPAFLSIKGVLTRGVICNPSNPPEITTKKKHLHIFRYLWNFIEFRFEILVVIRIGRHSVAVSEQGLSNSVSLLVMNNP